MRSIPNFFQDIYYLIENIIYKIFVFDCIKFVSYFESFAIMHTFQKNFIYIIIFIIFDDVKSILTIYQISVFINYMT